MASKGLETDVSSQPIYRAAFQNKSLVKPTEHQQQFLRCCNIQLLSASVIYSTPTFLSPELKYRFKSGN